MSSAGSYPLSEDPQGAAWTKARTIAWMIHKNALSAVFLSVSLFVFISWHEIRNSFDLNSIPTLAAQASTVPDKCLHISQSTCFSKYLRNSGQ